MATAYTQETRPLAITTPLGHDVLLLTGFTGRECMSQLFQFQAEMLAENRSAVPMDRLLGEGVTIELAFAAEKRYFHGIVSKMEQSGSDGDFTRYRMQIVPRLWLLTRQFRSRIFQQLSVPDILRQVFAGLDVRYQLQGTYHPRNYCAQYRESDFAFASRLMEEEGIFYYFKHSADGHQMIVADRSLACPKLPGDSRIMMADASGEEIGDYPILSWEKVQELRSGKVTLYDHHFELPDRNLEAQKATQNGVACGQQHHQLRLPANENLEVFDYPGSYAQRFDGIDQGGGERPADLERIFEDNQRTAGLRMQQEAVQAVIIRATSNHPGLTCGHKFTLDGHPNANDEYLITSVQHLAMGGDFRSGSGGRSHYHNTFTCIPVALPYRPVRMTPKSTVQGPQTAVVVGPPGEEIFVDKHGRVKVQFHWDREGQKDPGSSCWVRVAQAWAGKTYGAFFWPRVGHEVVVAFVEGDPDRPIVIGSVYNAENVPCYTLPKAKDVSGWVTQSAPGASEEEYSELSFDDEKGEELVYMRAQKDFEREVMNDDYLYVGNTQEIEIENGRKQTVTHGDDEVEIKEGDLRMGAKKSVLIGAGEAIWIGRGGGADLIYMYPGGGISIESSVGVLVKAPVVYLQASHIKLDAPLVEATGIVKCPILHANVVIADAVAGKAYTSGAGNIL